MDIVLKENDGLDAEIFTTSKIFADGINITHKAVQNLIQKHYDRFKRFGKVVFEIRPLPNSRTGQNEKIYRLNQEQATFLFTLSRNSEKVLDFKEKLVKAFYAMAKELQNRQITRQAGIIHRRTVTDAIKAFIPDSDHKKYAYKTYTDLIYKVVLGMNKKQYQQAFNIPQIACIKDYLTTEQLEKISKLEDLASTLLEFGQGYDQIKGILLGGKV
jgi:phage regulator Rha-like protein